MENLQDNFRRGAPAWNSKYIRDLWRPETMSNLSDFIRSKMYQKLSIFLSLGLNVFSSQAFECSTSAFAGILSPNATISYAVPVPAGGSWSMPSPEFPANDTGLPALCAIGVNVVSSPSSSFNFGLFLPQEWNSRFMASGNGGFGGGINWNDMETNALSEFASMSTDTGHFSTAFDASWALNNPESQLDWGYRAMHGSVTMAKAITEKYYGHKIEYSYYAACSTGGRQGLKEIQMFLDDFDGVLAGAPAWWTSHLQTWTLEIGLWNLPVDASYHIPSSLFPVISNEVFKQCDPQDGLVDGIISDPMGCDFFPEVLLCTPASNTSECLTGPQIKTLYKIYNDWVDVNDTFVFPHYEYGSEAQYTAVTDTDSGVPSPLGTSWVLNFLLNSTAQDTDWLDTFDYATVQLGDALNPGHANADDFDMSPFAARGGKLIQYHGLSDALIPTGSSIYFYKRVLTTLTPLGINVSDFYKFYLIPGMQHCSGSVGDAPWYIAGGGQPFTLGPTVHGVPGFEDPKHDALLALMQWVERGIEPEEIIATKFVDDTVALGVRRQRPLCPFPNKARYKGTGDPDLAESWQCQGLY
jgi:feruloyl esterase